VGTVSTDQCDNYFDVDSVHICSTARIVVDVGSSFVTGYLFTLLSKWLEGKRPAKGFQW